MSAPTGATEGHLYAIRFSNGTLKVGRTARPSTRLGQHRSDGRKFGLEVTDVYVSEPHRWFVESEKLLLEQIRAEQGPSTAGEYFLHADFTRAVEIIARLATEAPPPMEGSPAPRPPRSKDDEKARLLAHVSTLSATEQDAFKVALNGGSEGAYSLEQAAETYRKAQQKLTIWVRASAAMGMSEREIEQRSQMARMTVRKRLGK